MLPSHAIGRIRHIVAATVQDHRPERRRPQRQMEAVPDVILVHVRGWLPKHVHVARPELDHRRGALAPYPRVRGHVRSAGDREDTA